MRRFGQKSGVSVGVRLAEERKKLKEILEEFSSTRAYLVVFRHYMLFMLRVWFLCEFRFCFMIEVVRCDDRRMVFIFNWTILI